jgi:hypothetical protein
MQVSQRLAESVPRRLRAGLRLLNPRTAWRGFRAELWHSDPKTVLVLLGVLAMAWGVALLLPPYTFGLASFSWLASVYPNEDVWGIVAILCGLGQVVVVCNGEWAARAAMGVCDAMFWAFICVGMAAAAGGSPVPVLQFVVYALAGIWACTNAVRRRGGA